MIADVPWPWYAGTLAVLVAGFVWGVKRGVNALFRPLEQAQSGQWLPRATVDLMIKAKDEEIARIATAIASQRDDSIRAMAVVRDEFASDIASIRAEHANELTMIRDRHDRYMKSLDENHTREMTGLRSDMDVIRRERDDWKVACHLASAANDIDVRSERREVLEGIRLVLTVVEGLPLTPGNRTEANGGRRRELPAAAERE